MYDVHLYVHSGPPLTIKYSISDARKSLPRLIRDAERGAQTHITRRGETVAVLVGRRDYEKLKSDRGGLMAAFRRFHESVDAEDLIEDVDEFLKGIRDPSPGRDFRFDERNSCPTQT